MELDADVILARLAAIVVADTTKLTGHHLGACRYCWGKDHAYQWKTAREFNAAVTEASNKPPSLPPTDEGGYGYKITATSNPDCPECAGLGVAQVWYADTSKLTGAEKLLFESVEETKDGIRFKLADRSKALDALAKHFGVAKDKVEHVGKNGGAIEYAVKARVVIVPAKQIAIIETRPMPPDPETK